MCIRDRTIAARGRPADEFAQRAEAVRRRKDPVVHGVMSPVAVPDLVHMHRRRQREAQGAVVVCAGPRGVVPLGVPVAGVAGGVLLEPPLGADDDPLPPPLPPLGAAVGTTELVTAYGPGPFAVTARTRNQIVSLAARPLTTFGELALVSTSDHGPMASVAT